MPIPIFSRTIARPRGLALVLPVLMLLPPPVWGEETPPAAPPALLFAVPLAVPAGQPVQMTLRGRDLQQPAVALALPEGETATEVKSTEQKDPPNGLPKDRFGDVETVVFFTTPAMDHPADVMLQVTTAAGRSEPKPVRVVPAAQLVHDRVDNEGFATAVPFTIGQTIVGAIDGPRDVDVYRFEATAGRAVTFRLTAAGRGSPLDAVLTVYDAAGVSLIEADDRPELPPSDAHRRDPLLTITPAESGPCHLVVTDALQAQHPLYGYVIDTAFWTAPARSE